MASRSRLQAVRRAIQDVPGSATRSLFERRASRAVRSFVSRLKPILSGSGGAVAVIHCGTSELPSLLQTAYPTLSVHSFDAAAQTEGELHTRLAAHGPYQVIVDASVDGRVRAAQFRKCFWHLAEQGTYVVRDFRTEPRGAGASVNSGPARSVEKLVTSLATGRKRPAKKIPATPEYDRARIRAAIDRVVIERGDLLVTTNRTAFPKVREEEVDLLLAERGPEAGRVLLALEASEFASRCTWRPWPVSVQGRERAVYSAPPPTLREYRNVICAPEQVVIQGQVIMPDSYRHNAKKRLVNKALPEIAPRFAEPRRPLAGAEELAGTYFYLDNEHRGHFGHVLTEQVSKFWAWDEALRRHPDVKALVALNRKRELSTWECSLMAAAGIEPDEVTFVRSPVRVERLLAPTPMFSMPEYVHPAIGEVWRRMGDHLAASAPSWDWPRRIFCSRRITKRACHNTDDVEALFAAQGFEIVYTEDYALPDQVAMFRNAEIVGGFAGSALFNLCWATEPKRVVIVSSASYTARNEYMIGAVLGHEIDFVTSLPDIAQPAKGWTKEAFESGFTFDVEREGAYLRSLLASL